MGWDANLKVFTGKEYASLHYDWSMTYNVAPMYSKAIRDSGLHEHPLLKEGIRGLNEQLAESVVLMLDTIIKQMETYPEEYKLLNPENRWGSYDSALQFLKEIKKGCEDHPLAIFYIS